MSENPPEGVAESCRLGDLIEIPLFSRLLDNFFKSTGIPNCLFDPDGKLIYQAGWCDACALFHRVNPDVEIRDKPRKTECFAKN